MDSCRPKMNSMGAISIRKATGKKFLLREEYGGSIRMKLQRKNPTSPAYKGKKLQRQKGRSWKHGGTKPNMPHHPAMAMSSSNLVQTRAPFYIIEVRIRFQIQATCLFQIRFAKIIFDKCRNQDLTNNNIIEIWNYDACISKKYINADLVKIIRWHGCTSEFASIDRKCMVCREWYEMQKGIAKRKESLNFFDLFRFFLILLICTWFLCMFFIEYYK